LIGDAGASVDEKVILGLKTQMFSRPCIRLAASALGELRETPFVGTKIDLEHPDRDMVAKSMALMHWAILGADPGSV
jgi:hypothetical protein